MRRMTKHNSTVVTYNDFSGGLNVMSEGDTIAPNELQVCQNFWFTGYQRSLTPRGGLTEAFTTFPTDVRGTYYDIDTNTFLVFLKDGSIYRVITPETPPEKVGDLTGTGRPVCAKFRNKIWIASGDKLQSYDYAETESITTILDGPICNLVFQRQARLCAVQMGSDRISLSGMGDGTLWDEDTDDESAGAWIDVGYGDSGDIIAVAPLATDLIVIKDNGMVYQLTGDADVDSWAVYRIATETDPMGWNAAVPIGNDVAFISRQGMKTLATTQDYGNIAQGDIGEKWNILVTSGMHEPQLFHLRRRKNLLIRPTDDLTKLLAYNYAVGAATTLSFPIPITSMEETLDSLVVASGSSLYAIDDTLIHDMKGTPIEYALKLRDLTDNDQIIVRGIDCDSSAAQAGDIVLAVDDVKVTMPANTRRKVRCNHSSRRVGTTLQSTTPFRLKRLSLEVAGL